MIAATCRVESQNVHAGWAVHRQVQIMGHNVAIVGWVPALQRHPLTGLAIALVRLLWPREEEPLMMRNQLLFTK